MDHSLLSIYVGAELARLLARMLMRLLVLVPRNYGVMLWQHDNLSHAIMR